MLLSPRGALTSADPFRRPPRYSKTGFRTRCVPLKRSGPPPRTWYGVIVLKDFSASHHALTTSSGVATAAAPAAASCFPLSERT